RRARGRLAGRAGSAVRCARAAVRPPPHRLVRALPAASSSWRETRTGRRARTTLQGVGAFPVTRLRRLRRTGALRSLVRETRLDLEDFVMPLFVGPARVPIAALPAMGRWSVDDVVGEVDALVSSGVRAVILFGIPDEKDEEGSGAWDDDGVIQRALRE